MSGMSFCDYRIEIGQLGVLCVCMVSGGEIVSVDGKLMEIIICM